MQIVELLDPRVRALPIVDDGEPMRQLDGLSAIAYGEAPEGGVDTAPFYRWLRKGVIERLERAQARLPRPWRLRVYEGYRSPAVQARLFDEELHRVAARHPSWSDEARHREACQLASPLRLFSGEAITPPHSTGGAVDVEIVDGAGAVIDFGMEAKDWGAVEPEVCATAYAGVSAAARRHRALLVDVLGAEGFVNYPREWWHFSFGDRYWAFHSGAAAARYGTVPEAALVDRPGTP